MPIVVGEDVQARISKGAGKRVSPYYEFNVTADDALNITRVWNQPYSVIHQANSLLERIESGVVATDDVTALNCIKAEALALRGLALFDLTRLFAMPYTLDNGASLGVPIEIKNDTAYSSACPQHRSRVLSAGDRRYDGGRWIFRPSLLTRRMVISMYGVSKHCFRACIFI